MKRILVVTDNIIQFDKIKLLLRQKDRKDIKIDFRHSPLNSPVKAHADFSEGNFEIDVKLEADRIILNYDLVISVHCFQFFPKELVSAVRCINIHPGYNPINRGWYPQVFAILNDLKIGATIHEMDAKLDNGPIIARCLVEKFDWDTSYSLYHRILEAEIRLFDMNFDDIIDQTYHSVMPEGKGNMFRKADFNALCQLDMDKQGTFREFYDLLRALSHGEYKNAYFFDDTGQKIYVKIDVEK